MNDERLQKLFRKIGEKIKEKDRNRKGCYEIKLLYQIPDYQALLINRIPV